MSSINDKMIEASETVRLLLRGDHVMEPKASPRTKLVQNVDKIADQSFTLQRTKITGWVITSSSDLGTSSLRIYVIVVPCSSEISRIRSALADSLLSSLGLGCGCCSSTLSLPTPLIMKLVFRKLSKLQHHVFFQCLQLRPLPITFGKCLEAYKLFIAS
jgi:hypothetical protein